MALSSHTGNGSSPKSLPLVKPCVCSSPKKTWALCTTSLEQPYTMSHQVPAQVLATDPTGSFSLTCQQWMQQLQIHRAGWQMTRWQALGGLTGGIGLPVLPEADYLTACYSNSMQVLLLFLPPSCPSCILSLGYNLLLSGYIPCQLPMSTSHTRGIGMLPQAW